MNVSECLFIGKPNARPGRELCEVLHITIRELTNAIERERREGAPICAATGKTPGYYLAANKEEMKRYCRSLYRRAREIHKTRRACRNTLDRLPPY